MDQDDLEFYALFKQANFGDCNELNEKRPGKWDRKGMAMWDAWHAMKGTNQK